MRDIAITGMGCRFPGAPDLTAYWRLLQSGEPQFRPLSPDRWRHETFFAEGNGSAPDRTYVDRVAYVDDVEQFAALHYSIAPRRAQVMDPQHRILLDSVRAALQDAGLEERPFDRSRAGVFIGISGSEYQDVMSAGLRARQLADGTFGPRPSEEVGQALLEAAADLQPLQAYTLPGAMLNMAAATVSHVFDLGGPSVAVDAACSASLAALNEAVMHLRAGSCRAAVVGGVYLSLIPDTLVAFARVGAVSPTRACRPFDERADGFVFGEGVGAVVLRPLDDALAAGDRIYAVIRGIGCNNDGRAEGPMTPKMTGQLAALRQAYDDAGIDPRSIGYVEAHGTATVVGDRVEAQALAMLRQTPEASGGHGYVSSVKSIIGHSMASAGMAGLIKAVLSVYHGQIAPQPDVQPHPEIGSSLEAAGLRLPTALTDWPAEVAEVRRAGVSSFGFGGTNVHVVLEQAPEIVTEPVADRPELFLFSADDPALLESHLGEFLALIEQDPQLSMASLAYTLATRSLLNCRVAVVAAGPQELKERLQAAGAALAEGRTDGQVADGVFLKSGPLRRAQRGVAFLYPGQGSQQPGMVSGLIERFPQIRGALAELDEQVREVAGFSVYQAVHGPEADTPAGRERLTGTEVCQPALGAHWLALTRMLQELALQPVTALGHSVGEFPAAAGLGLLAPSAAVSFMAGRGRAMARVPLADPGTMLALRCTRPEAERLLEGVTGAWVANHNHPGQVVISGTHEGIAAVERQAAGAEVAAKRLTVSHAFHSPLFGGIEPEMAALVGRYAPSGPTERLVSCISGASGHTPAKLAELWTRHPVAPVEFADAVRTCAEAGATVYVQIGGGSTLLSMARATLAGDEAPKAPARWFVPLTDARSDGVRAFLAGIGQLAALGVGLDPMALFADGHAYRVLDLPITPLATKPYWAVARGSAASAPQAASSGKAIAVRSVPGADGPAQPDAVLPVLAADGPAAQDTGSAAASVPARISEWMTSSMDQQIIALFREQAAVFSEQAAFLTGLAAGGATGQPRAAVPQALPAAAPAEIAPAPAAAAPAQLAPAVAQADREQAAQAAPASVSAELIEATVLGEAARVSAFPADVLQLEQTIVGDLGFDSLMIADLVAGVNKVFPQVEFDAEFFGMSTTLAAMIAYVGERSGASTGSTPVAVPAPAAEPAAQPAVPAAEERPKVAAVTDHRPAVAPQGGTEDVPVPSSAYLIEEFAEVKELNDRFKLLAGVGLPNPYFTVHDGVTRDTSLVEGEPVINFSSYNYLGMSGHPAVVKAAQDAAAKYGTSASASRMLSGEKPVHQELEVELAAHLGTEDAIAMVSGHATNVTVIGHIVGPTDLIVHDALAHDSILQGCKLSGATRRPFPHNDFRALDGMLGKIRRNYRRVLIVLEGVYSMDGDIPDLPAFIEVKKKHQALLMIDEAHSIGVIGPKGGGIGEYFDVDRNDVELWAGTMSKSLAGCGGYIGGSRQLIEYLKYTAPGFIYSVGMTPPNAAASLAALRQLRAEPELLTQLRERSRLFLRLAKEAGIDTGDSKDSPVVPCVVRSSYKAMLLGKALLDRGINVNPIVYPAVAEDQARLRFFITTCHTEEQIRFTVQTVAEELGKLDWVDQIGEHVA